MEQLANYDPYTITQVQFNVNKIARYSTLKSIISTLLILILTVFLSFQNIKNIWLPLSQLPFYSIDNYNVQPMREFPVCVVAVNKNDPVPESTAVQIQLSSSIRTPIAKTNAYDNNENILKIANGRQFVCFQLEGYYIDTFYKVQIFAGGFPDIYVKMNSYAQLTNQKEYDMIKIQLSQYFNLTDAVYAYSQITAKKIKGQIYDSLFPNSDPHVIVNFQRQFLNHYKSIETQNGIYHNNSTYLQLLSQSLKNSNNLYLTQEYTILRQDIATIISKVLAWFTIIMVIFQLMVSPIVDWSCKMTLCKLIYQNQTLKKLQLSITSFCKFIITKLFCKSLFQEGTLHGILQNLEKDMNILNILKRQQLMRKLIKQSQDIQSITNQNFFRLQQQRSQFSLQSNEDGLSYDQIQLLTHGQHDHDQIKIQKNINHSFKGHANLKFSVQKDQKAPTTTNFILQFIQSFDIGQTCISLITNKGKGYGNKWNTILTALAFIGLLSFMIIAGFLTISTNSTISTVVNSVSSQPNQYTITPNELIIRMKKFNPALDKFYVRMETIDENFASVQNVSLLSGSACNKIVSDLGRSDTGWYCLQNNVTIRNNGKGDTLRLRFYPFFYTASKFTFANMEVVIKSSTINEETMEIDNLPSLYFLSKYLNNIYKNIVMQPIIQKSEQSSKSDFFSYIPQNIDAMKFNVQIGYVFSISPQVVLLQKTNDTIWDVITNSWGIVILCFSLFLARITKYINLKERRKIITNQESDGRNDIVTILTTQDKLQNSAFRQELESVRYFYKSRLSSDDLKRL